MTTPAISAAYGVMFAAGVGIPIMAALNANLGTRIENPTAAGFILLLVGLSLTGVALAIAGPPSRASLSAVPPIYYLAGFFVAFYVLSITWAAPHIGVGTAVFLVLLGQLAATAVIDHYGAFGALESSLTPRRTAGIILIAVGIFLARRME